MRRRAVARPLSPGGPRRRRVRRVGGHGRRLPPQARGRRGGRARLGAGDARARPAAALPDDLRVRRVRPRLDPRTRRGGAPAIPLLARAGRAARPRRRAPVLVHAALAVLAEERPEGPAPGMARARTAPKPPPPRGRAPGARP